MTMPLELMLRGDAQDLGAQAYDAALKLGGQANNIALIQEIGKSQAIAGVNQSVSTFLGGGATRSGGYLTV